MSERELEQLIQDWYRENGHGADALQTAPTPDCPPLTVLWRHHTAGAPLGRYEEHARQCDRCQRLGEIIRHEPPLVFRNAFLVAADVINETLERGHDGKLIPIASRNVVVYFAADDLALRASKVANARQVSRRLGHTGPEDMARVPANVYAKDCDNFNNQYDTKSGHTYFLHAPDGSLGRLLIDMIECVRTGRVPGAGGSQRTFML